MKSSNRNSLRFFLAYELNQSIRHRHYVSLVLLSQQSIPDKIPKTLERIVRHSDMVFFFPNYLAILMGETEKAEALKAVERYQESINGAIDVRCSVASFPYDGKTPLELMYTAIKRLQMAYTLECRSIVAWG